MDPLRPRVSICVPNLNTRPHLPERFATIFDQSLTDWELLVYDSHSTDGSWEYILETAAGDPRIRAWQGPREGTPGSWTPCVRQARGEYVYIATSDDTMAPDLLETMAGALEAHPECDLAHCTLRAIDADGKDLPATMEWWRRGCAMPVSSGPLLDVPHIRRAPFDGLLHLLGGSVYVSITQLLIRRSLFDRIGFFTSTWGSVGDFNWSMRAGLVANTIHVPGTWGGWRVHAAQATAAVGLASREHAHKVDAMIDDAVHAVLPLLDARVRRPLLSRWLADAAALRHFVLDTGRLQARPLPLRAGRIAAHVCAGSAPARAYVRSRVLHRPLTDWVSRRLSRACSQSWLIPADVPSAGCRVPPFSAPAARTVSET